jgi:DNA-binding transcriptional MerR regulator
MNAFTIKDLENLSGIKAHTIRIWEQRYTFLKPQRTDTNIRYYSNEELKTLLNIALLNKYGYKISHIDKMDPLEWRNKVISLTNLEAQQERLINELIQCMIDLEMDQFEKLMDQHISSQGIEATILQIIFPFLEKIGILWLTDHIHPAQEHLITNIIRQKLVLGIEKAYSPVSVNKTVLLFLPEGEHHELGLLYLYYLLKSRGAKILYLGANVPLKDVEFVARIKQPDYLYTHLTSVGGNFSLDKFIQQLHARLNDFPLIISGQISQNYKKKLPEPVILCKSLYEVNEFVGSL